MSKLACLIQSVEGKPRSRKVRSVIFFLQNTNTSSHKKNFTKKRNRHFSGQCGSWVKALVPSLALWTSLRQGGKDLKCTCSKGCLGRPRRVQQVTRRLEHLLFLANSCLSTSFLWERWKQMKPSHISCANKVINNQTQKHTEAVWKLKSL